MTFRSKVKIGFMPLADAAPLIAAKEFGFAAAEGLELTLCRETSWATIRDRLSVGHLDAAHALAPLPIAANLGMGPIPMSMAVPIALGFGANTVTVSQALWADMESQGARADFDCVIAGRSLARVVATRRRCGADLLVFGIVHQQSAHRYQLAYWLASCGVLPGRDIALVVLPPSLMPAALESGRIDGFCAGEPWGSVALQAGAGQTIITNTHIWRSSPEKVLAARETWVAEDSGRADALTRAIYKACMWCDEPANRRELAIVLARLEYVGAPLATLLPSLMRELRAPNGAAFEVAPLLTFAAGAASFPWKSHALWFMSQMARWGEVELTAGNIERTRATYRPDLCRRALEPIGVPLPAANAKVEGALPVATPIGSATGRLTLAADGFFDGQIFDPDQVVGYVTALKEQDLRIASAV